jgi:dipeptidyl aminopeptidase/acylaminoacyl peptidase
VTRAFRPALVATLAGYFCANLAGATPMSPERSLEFRRINGLSFAPDGKRLAFVVSEWVKNQPRTHLWMLDVAAGTVRQWTSGEGSDRLPQWSPDGKGLTFLSSRGGKSQVYWLPADSADATPIALTHANGGVSGYRWSPDGSKLVFLSGSGESAPDPHVWDRPEELEQLWIEDVASRQSRQLTQGNWRIQDFAWAGSERLLAIASPLPWTDAWTDTIYDVLLDDGRLRPWSAPSQPFGRLTVSPDGSRIGYVGARGGGPNPHDLFLWAKSDQHFTNVTASLDRPVRAIRWRDGDHAVLSVADGFWLRLYSLGSREGLAHVDLPRSARDFDVARNGTIAYVGHAFDAQAELFLRDPKGRIRQVSHFHADWDSTRLSPPAHFRYRSFDGQRIEAVLLKPSAAPPSGGYPLVLLVHGGPGSAFDASCTYWFGAWAQLLVSHGYEVLLVNPRGSEGYGEEFLKANRGDWGGGDYRDLIAAVDTVLARGETDPRRLGIGGWSYGGYMSQWAPTQTDRFHAAVAGAGTFDLIAEYETEDFPAGDEWYFGTPWENSERFLASSPNVHIKSARTPTLILHGEGDPANPVAQSIGYYRALKRYGVPCELVVYPREGHLPRELGHQTDILRRMLDWFDRYMK